MTFALVLLVAFAGTTPDSPLVTVSLHAAAPAHKGEPHILAARFTVAPGWHIYWRNPGDSGLKTDVQWKLPRGFSPSAVAYQTPTRFKGTAGAENYGYEGEAWLFTTVKGPPRPQGSVTARVRWLACTAEECVPGESDQTLAWPASEDALTARMAEMVPRRTDSAVSPVKGQAGRAVWVIPLAFPTEQAEFIPDLPAGFHVVSLEPEGANLRVTLETRRPKVPQRLRGVVVDKAATAPPRSWEVDVAFP